MYTRILIKCDSWISSYFFMLVPPSSLPQWGAREAEHAAGSSEETQRMIDGLDKEDEEEEEEEPSTPGNFHNLSLR